MHALRVPALTNYICVPRWAIVDEVHVPNVTGDFVLRWRWDTEQNPQIWTHCADVTIV